MVSKSIYTLIAASAIEYYLNNNTIEGFTYESYEPKLEEKLACFVTLKTNKNKLRGCIGTIEPAYKNLKKEIISNAIASATRDTRFGKVNLSELKKINISVEILSEPEKINDINKLNPKKYGIIISNNQFQRGVLLPDIEGVDTIEEQIRIVKRKAGIFEPDNKNLEFYRFTTKKYY